jgi:peptidyl-prolyl cis-trans isomerase B (cyclophilin B)
VIVVAVVIGLMLCVGGVIAGVVAFVSRGDDEPQAGAVSAGSSTAQTSRSAPLGCTTVPRSGPERKAVGPPDFSRATNTGTATMTITTNRGVLTIAMDRAKTPCTIASFQHLASKRFFDNTPCHRLTTDGIHVLQCGDPSGTGSGGPDYDFPDENLSGATYDRGVVAMANAGPGTNGSQFFIVYGATPLNAAYTVFGRVTAGLDVVERVAAAGVAAGGNSPTDGKPTLEVTVQSLAVE